MSASLTLNSGLFVTVEFVKADGTTRRINGRSDVKKYLQPGSTAWDNSDPDYLVIYTRQGSRKFDAARFVARNRIISIKANGQSMQQNPDSKYKKPIRA